MLMVRFNVVAIFLYLFPALLYIFLTNLSKNIFYDDSLFAIKVSIFFTIFGFLAGLILSKKLTFKLINYSSHFYLILAKLLIFLAICSVSIQLFKFGIPVFNNSIREYIQQGFFGTYLHFHRWLVCFLVGMCILF